MRLFIISLFLSTALISDFILKDELGLRKEFHDEVEKIATELFQKTSIEMFMLILHTTNGENITKIAKEELAKHSDQSLILAFTEVEKKVDIVATSSVLKLFDKEQVLSPFPWKGTILPILGERIKKDPREKYSVALFNGFADIAEQIANSKKVVLESAVGNANKFVLNIVRAIFYFIITLALGYMIFKKFFKKGENNEK